jgi:hypothetical protein
MIVVPLEGLGDLLDRFQSRGVLDLEAFFILGTMEALHERIFVRLVGRTDNHANPQAK